MNRDRRKEIVECARTLFEEQGLSKTSVRNITDRLGVTRTLFYHYFADKDELTSAVLDDYVSEFMQTLQSWIDDRENRVDVEHALDGAAKLLRTVVFENGSFRRALTSYENASLYIAFLNRVAEQLSSAFVDTLERNEMTDAISISHLRETLYVLIIGISGYVRNHPDADDEIVKDIIAQTLHMDRPSGKE